jgi:hypothetical protein
MVELFRLPDISGTEKEQLAKVRSYLYQLIPALNYAIERLGTSKETIIPTGETIRYMPTTSGGSSSGTIDAESTFNAIKSFIIGNSEIAESYSDVIRDELKDYYVASGEYGAYVDATRKSTEETASGTTHRFDEIKGVISDVDSKIGKVSVSLGDAQGYINNLNNGIKVDGDNVFVGKKTTAWITTGKIAEDAKGNSIYGVEIGQGDESSQKVSRFAADRVSFYDNDGNESTYFSNKKMSTIDAVINGIFQIGGFQYVVDDKTNDVITRWVG